mgnify:CR=1 FL=1
MTYKTISTESVSSLKGASGRSHQGWTFIVFKGRTYGYKGSIQELKDHQGAFELTVSVDEEGREYGHCHLAEVL